VAENWGLTRWIADWLAIRARAIGWGKGGSKIGPNLFRPRLGRLDGSASCSAEEIDGREPRVAISLSPTAFGLFSLPPPGDLNCSRGILPWATMRNRVAVMHAEREPDVAHGGEATLIRRASYGL
jgi:hypothetical protein